MIRTMTTAAAALGLAATGAYAASGYALTDDGATLVVMADIENPGDVTTNELANPVDAIAYRPVTGDLLGITNGMIYTIDPMSGEMTDLGASFAEDATLADGAMIAFDFNNAIDAVRALSSSGDNLVYFPDGFGDGDERAGTVIRVTDLFYAEGDDNADATPMVFANAYTNAISGMTAESTFQYGLDAETDSLVSVANNDGTLETIGAVMVDGEAVDLSGMGGFDILSAAEGENEGYAILQMEGGDTAGLYSIDLETGEATMLADLGMGGFSGFAVAPSEM
ncbi:DUF4394 domain-containing protein [Pelagovum pacificum]|uniref:DUF4394 domain-containing protein n=1 Tax=Pelagovum pacificum TaxID=2588711 RepID=A0A5C5GCY9_9RHOB|nr:DUF4394 domain-containing protein [Pelagovum pacificum]QQA41337.1 DUF4394 domain-containing protein [Pelagovum pacificum]TNY31857.1 DUF4394 domain-containing protein [Pelagovum pacificum]